MLSQYKLYIFIALFLTYTLGVWHVHSWYDGYKNEKVAVAQVEKAQDGQNKIIEFHQQIEKVYVKVKEPCLDTTIPPDINGLLE